MRGNFKVKNINILNVVIRPKRVGGQVGKGRAKSSKTF